MNFPNPYEPPKSSVSAKLSVVKEESTRRKVLKVLIGSAIAALLEFGAGLFAATIYTNHYHPNDPDPVDFTIGAVLLLVWASVWLIGTVLSIWLSFRGSAVHSA